MGQPERAAVPYGSSAAVSVSSRPAFGRDLDGLRTPACTPENTTFLFVTSQVAAAFSAHGDASSGGSRGDLLPELVVADSVGASKRGSDASQRGGKSDRVRSMEEVILEQAVRRASKRQTTYLPALEVAGRHVCSCGRRREAAERERPARLPRIELAAERSRDERLLSSPPADNPYSLYRLDPMAAKRGEDPSNFADKRINDILRSEGLRADELRLPAPTVLPPPNAWSRRSLPTMLPSRQVPDQLVLIPRRRSVALQLSVLEATKDDTNRFLLGKNARQSFGRQTA